MSCRCQFSSQHRLGYVTKQAGLHSSFISSATCDSSEFRVLQEAWLMLMCHRWGLLKARFICLSVSTEVLLTSDHIRAWQWDELPVLSWSRVPLASIYICQVQTLHFTTHVDHIAKYGHHFKLLLGLIYFRVELTQDFNFFGSLRWRWRIDWHLKCLFSQLVDLPQRWTCGFLQPQEKTMKNYARFGFGRSESARVSLTVPPDGSYTLCAREGRHLWGQWCGSNK